MLMDEVRSACRSTTAEIIFRLVGRKGGKEQEGVSKSSAAMMK